MIDLVGKTGRQSFELPFDLSQARMIYLFINLSYLFPRNVNECHVTLDLRVVGRSQLVSGSCLSVKIDSEKERERQREGEKDKDR